MKVFNIRAFRANLKEAINRPPVAITRNGKVVAILSKPTKEEKEMVKSFPKPKKTKKRKKKKVIPDLCPKHNRARIGDFYGCGCKV